MRKRITAVGTVFLLLSGTVFSVQGDRQSASSALAIAAVDSFYESVEFLYRLIKAMTGDA